MAFNPSDKSADINLSNGNLTASRAAGTGWRSVRSVAGHSSGKWYGEINIDTNSSSNGGIIFGIGKSTASLSSYCGSDANGWGLQSNNSANRITYHNGSPTNISLALAGAGSKVQVAIDLGSGKVWFGVNNTWSGNPAAGTGEAYSGISGTLYLMASHDDTGVITLTNNYSPPSGFSVWDGVFSQTLIANSTVSASLSMLTIFARTLSATVTTAASIKRDITKRLSSTITTSATSIKSIAKSLQSSITSSALLSTGNLIELTATITMSAELLALRILTKALEATATVDAFISRIAAKTLSAVSHAQAQLSRIAQKSLSASVSISPGVSKTPTKHLTVSATVAAISDGLVTRLRTLTASATAQAVMGKLPYKVLAATITASASFMRRVYKILTAEITITPSLIYDITRIVREYLWARQQQVTLWATNKSERIIAVSKDALLLAKQTTKRLWK
jgi:hypothetical protein